MNVFARSGKEALIEDVAIRAQSIQKEITLSRHLPGECYASEEIFELEQEELFKKEWIILGREEQIPKPGDYFTRKLGGEPILLTRSKDGQIRGFYNVCRHRGVEVAFDCGHKKSFSCPYHGWVYGLDGKLLSAPLMESAEGFDKQHNGLVPVRTATWGGFIFVNLDENAPELLDVLGIHLKNMEFLKMEDCQVADTWDVTVSCNWKLIIENVMDVYHVALLHSDTLGKNWDDNSVKINVLPLGSNFSEFKNPTLTEDGKSRFGNLPWLPELEPDFANALCLPPNTMMFGRCDSMYVFNSYPLSSGETHVQVHLLLPKVHAEISDYEDRVKPYGEFMRAVLGEDMEMLASIQKNFKSNKYVPGQMAPLEEGIRHFLSSYIDRLFNKYIKD